MFKIKVKYYMSIFFPSVELYFTIAKSAFNITFWVRFLLPTQYFG